MTEAVTIALVAATATVCGAAISFFAGRKINQAETQNKNANTIDLQSRTINSLSDKLDDLRNEFDQSKVEVEQKEIEIRELKDYIKELLAFLENKGVDDYPKPKKNLLDTHPRMKAVK